MTSRKQLTLVPLALAALAVIAGCSAPEHPKPPPGVTFGKRLVNGGTESDEDIVGSEAVVARFINAMRAHDPSALMAMSFNQDKPANATSLIRNYADLINGSVTVTFTEDKDDRSRTACLNYPRYPYQLYLFIVRGNNGKDSAHWKTDMGSVQGAPPSLKPGQPTPPPHHDQASFCQDGLSMGAPGLPTGLSTDLHDPTSPVLSGKVTRPVGAHTTRATVTGQFFLHDSSNVPVGDSPLGIETADANGEISLRVPAGLIQPGTTYKWTMQACVKDTCSPETAATTFTAPAHQ